MGWGTGCMVSKRVSRWTEELNTSFGVNVSEGILRDDESSSFFLAPYENFLLRDRADTNETLFSAVGVDPSPCERVGDGRTDLRCNSTPRGKSNDSIMEECTNFLFDDGIIPFVD